jgi:osmotically-inducible protein OsmY
MNRYFYTSVLALALVTAYAVSQTGNPSSSQPSNQPQSQTSTPDASQSTSPSSNNPSSKDQSSTGQSMPQSDQTTGAVDDQTLHTKIHEQLSTNPALSNVNVTVNNGVVTLDGSVASKQDKKDAEKIAQSVPGVKKVKDKLKVGAASSSSTAPPSSSYFSSSQQSSSTTPPSTSSQDTGAASQSSGQTGTPPSGQSSTQTGTASGMPQGDMNTATDNSTLQNQIQTALKNEPTLANDAVTVNVTDNSVELSGTASSKKERQTAKRIAQSYANNRKVVEHITVSGSSSTTTPSDSNPPDKTTNPEGKNDNKNPSTPPPDQSYPK